MVDLVLEDVAQEPRGVLSLHGAVLVGILERHALVAQDGAVYRAHRQAALGFLELPARGARNFRVDVGAVGRHRSRAFAVFRFFLEYAARDDEDAQALADLRRGDGDAVLLGRERVAHLPYERREGGGADVLFGHGLRYPAQDGVALLHDEILLSGTGHIAILIACTTSAST